jgi:hypothetical protein
MPNPLRRAVAGAAIAGLAGTASLVGLSPAHSVPPTEDAQCPDTYPVADLVKGQPVDGLTVSSGTVPDTFSGEVLGVLNDGIAPGLDMILVRLSSDEIDRVGGIWEGMSGSPVYAADGRLIGAVSYGLAYGSSPVAGVTPAGDMKTLLDRSPGTDPAQSQPAHTVRLSRSLQHKVVTSGAATQAEASSGLDRLPVPVAVSGVFNTKRLNKLSKHLGMDGVRLYRSGSAPSAAAAGDPSDIFAGSNLAASLAYGDFSAVGTGTTTMVCDGNVVAFGHPFNFDGDTSLTLHGADAIYIQEDPLGAPFKVSNATAPVGTIDEDRMEGIKGELGSLPDTTLVHSLVTLGAASRTGDSYVSLPLFVPDASAFATLGNQDRVLDRVGKGSSLVHFTVDGHTAGGEPFTLVRTNRFADDYDISYGSVFELADDLYQLVDNDFTDVTIDSVNVETDLSNAARAFTMGSVQAKVGKNGVYKKLGNSSRIKAQPGRTVYFKVTLKSRKDAFGSKVVTTSVKVPATTQPGTYGSVSLGGGSYLSGGGEDFGDDSGFGDTFSAPKSFDGLIDQLSSAPRSDDLTAILDFFPDRGQPVEITKKKAAGDVINDARMWDIVVRP